MASTLKRLLVGPPIPTREERHHRLPKTIALAVFSSDAISSTAYATEEILRVLMPAAGAAATASLLPISLVVIVLLALVASSYRQTIHAYPNGGGAYIVSRENLGVVPSLVAGASLLVDYTLTVSVSVAAGVAAITSAVPALRTHRVSLVLSFVAVVMLGNLRGMKESGRLFAVPTYAYILMIALLIGAGLWQQSTGHLPHLAPSPGVPAEAAAQGVTLFLLMRAFSSGAVALTGVEAISNGVPAFRPPEDRNAATTLTWMACILGASFLGISYLTQRAGALPTEHETVLSVLGSVVFGRGFLYGLLQAATCAILVVAANTAFADFPRLSALMARDRFLPTQLVHRGDRLVFSNGILLLAAAASTLLVVFHGDTSALIPLYAVGVFTSFTLSQAGMVRHHLRLREHGWRWRTALNAVGCAATLLVLVVVVVSKFTIGAWIPAVLIPLLVMLFKGIHRHYERVAAQLEVDPGWRPPALHHTFVVLVKAVHKGSLQALAYAETLEPRHLAAVAVVFEDDEEERLQKQWAELGLRVPLEVIRSPYRRLVEPVLDYLDELEQRWDDDVVTVVIPEYVVRRWWEHLLHNQDALHLKARLWIRRDTAVTSVPCHLD